MFSRDYVRVFTVIAFVFFPGKIWNAAASDRPPKPGSQRVLCLHGYQDNCASFDQLVPLLDRRHEYLCFDLPNHGLSSGTPPGTRWTLEHYATTVKRVAEHVRWSGRPFVCMGHSMGGQIALVVAAVWPEDVGKLVLLDSAGPVEMCPEDVVPATRRALDELLRLEGDGAQPPRPAPRFNEPGTALRRVKQRSYGSTVSETLTDQAGENLMTRFYRRLGPAYVMNNDARLKVTYSDLFSAGQHGDVVDNIRCPTLVVRAAEGRAYLYDIYALFVDLYDANPHFRIVTVPGNHDVHMNCPNRVAPIVNGFLNDGLGKL